MDDQDLLFIQEQIDYRFKNVDLLQQAFVRRSYARENGGEDNEVLEFIGDKVLDFIVVKILAEKYGSFVGDYEEFNEFTCRYQEGKLTGLKKKLVEKKMLAHRIDILNFADFLIMGNSDIKNNVGEEDSVKEDLFEAIIGAVALDSAWNIAEIQSAVELMLDPDDYLSEGIGENYVEFIQEWVLKKYKTIPLYYFEEITMSKAIYSYSGSRRWGGIQAEARLPKESRLCTIQLNQVLMNNIPLNRTLLMPMSVTAISTQVKENCKYFCILKMGEYKIFFRGFGKSKNEARKDACELAYNYLKENDLLYTIQDEIYNPNKNEAINQLETLARRGYFSIPTYEFKQEYGKNGNSVWKCKCHIEEKEKIFWSKSSSKKDAKKEAAYAMLMYVLDHDI